MFPNINFMDYFKEVANSTRFQISASVSFGTALVQIWLENNDPVKITFIVLFLFATCMFIVSIIEKIFGFIYSEVRRRKDWKNLTSEELEFVKYYINGQTKTRYVVAYNGTWSDSGIINPLCEKGILYLASNISEYRGESFMTMEQNFPFNIHDKAYDYFAKKLSD